MRSMVEGASAGAVKPPLDYTKPNLARNAVLAGSSVPPLHHASRGPPPPLRRGGSYASP